MRKSGTLRIAAYALLGLAAIALLVLLGRQLGGYVPRFAAWVAGLGVWGPVAFILGYLVATVAFVPGLVLTLAAGAIFGLLWGTVYTLVGATLGAAAAFLVARYLARARIERRIAAHPSFQAIDRAVSREGFKIVALLRLSPVFPFNLLNYALGLTRVRLRDYLLASIAMLPGTLVYVYYGKAAGSLATAAAGKFQKGTGYWVSLGLGLAATVAVTAFITRLASRALKSEIGPESDALGDEPRKEAP
jgi:uncharacterized membrane protein YdjX (TVP38/TMEM64 family)